LKYYRGELSGCADIHAQDLEKLVEDIDIHILQLVTGKKGASIEELSEAALQMQIDEQEVVDSEAENNEEEVEVEKEDEGEDEDEDDEEYDDFNVDIEQELGLDSAEVAES
jgi:hypothetical protein